MRAPVTQFVLKVHSRCNLACDHCYIYEHADQGWRSQPQAISAEVVTLAAKRISEHAAARQLPAVSVVLHGGEPLLLGRSMMRGLLAELSAQIGAVTQLDLRIHTNGVLLDQQWCDLFRDFGVQVGLSLDGDRAANDRHRRYRDGRSSHEQVLAGLRLLRRLEYQHLYAGILCTIDLGNDPVAVYRALSAEQPPRLDLLLPHATWETPPPRPPGQPAAYADWLLRVFRCWDADGRPMPVRIFDSVLSAAQGGPSFTEALGTEPGSLLVIEANGDWEQPDSMKTAYHGAAATGMTVSSHGVDDVSAHPALAARLGGLAGLSVTCRACPVVGTCGGGLYAHRFKAGTGFDNPSVYCDDLEALISGMLAADRDRAAPRAVPELRRPAAPPPASVADSLSPVGFGRLAAGPGDRADIAALTGQRLAEARSLVIAIARSEVGWRDAGLRQAARQGWELLSALSRDHPQAVNEVLAHPYTYAWAVRCLRPPAGSDADLERAHLAGLALGAAFRAGTSAELPCPVRDGRVFLPTAGSLAVAAAGSRTAYVTVTPGRPPTAPGGRWHPARYLGQEPFSGLLVEDLDPYRDCQAWPATGRLSAQEWQHWQRDLAAAGAHLGEAVPGYADGLAAGLRAVTPLRPPAAGRRSATARQAFGAVAIACPALDAPRDELAELLLHEFQHVKLNVLMDLRPLCHRRPDVRLRVPWREDPRPPDGVLQGIYAFLALVHLHRAEGPAGHVRYLKYRAWLDEALTELLAAGDVLTPDGLQFVQGMAAAADGAVR